MTAVQSTSTMDPSLVPENAVTADIVDGKIKLGTSFREKDLVKMIPGANYNRREGFWHTRVAWTACKQLRGVFGDRLVIGPELEKWAWNEYISRVQPTLTYRDAEDVPGYNDPDLYPRQKAGVEFLVHARHAIIGDEVGAGKTRQTIKTLERLDTYPALVVATKSAKEGAWREEFERVAPHRKVIVVGGSAKQRREQLEQEADVYVIHWQIARLHSRVAGYGYIKLTDEEKEPKELNKIPFKAVIADEAHRMQDPKSKQTRAVWALGEQVDDATGCRLALTGTPLDKDISQAWPLLHFVMPDEYPSKTAFIERYALQTWSPFGFNTIAGLKPETRDEFFSFFDTRFLRRPTKVVVPDLPDPIYAPARKVELKGKQKKAYKQMQDGLLAELEGGTLMAKDPLTQLVRLRQLATAYGEIVDAPDGGSRMQLVDSPASPVIDELVDFIKEELGDTQALVFSEGRQIMELTAARLDKENISNGLITGMVPETERDARRKDFQAGGLQILGLTVDAGGESLTLTGAKAMIFIERSFSLRKNKQATGRAIRPGQDTRVLIVDIVPILGYKFDKGLGREVEIPTVASRAHEALVEKGVNFEEVVRDQRMLERAFGKKIKS